MPTKKLDTAAKLALSNRRAGARRVRAGITEKINDLLPQYPTGEGREVLDKLGDYIAFMIGRDKKRAGGLWN